MSGITQAFHDIIRVDVLSSLGNDWRWSGDYVLKPWYHSSVNDNDERFGRNYSNTRSTDRRGPLNRGRAIDYTSRSAQGGNYAQMIRLTRRAIKAYDDPLDTRSGPHNVAEFYGTVNGRTVIGRRHGYAATSDNSHLWHFHLGIATEWIGNAYVLRAIASVLKGETYATWLEREHPGSAPKEKKEGSSVITPDEVKSAVLGAEYAEFVPRGTPANTRRKRSISNVIFETHANTVEIKHEIALLRSKVEELEAIVASLTEEGQS
jgi:hypothetical protein